MMLVQIRVGIFRRNPARSTLVLLAVVIALLAGLLAMHTLTSTMESHDGNGSATLVMASETGHSAHGAVPNLPESVVAECFGTCEPDHTMAAMACILALLAATLALGAARSSNGAIVIARSAQHHRDILAVAAREARPPPDLKALSISRT